MSWVGPWRFGSGPMQSDGLNGKGTNCLVLVAAPSTRTHGAQDVATSVLDNHRARLRQKLSMGSRRQGDKEIGIVFGSLAQCSAGNTHPNGAPSLGLGNVKSEHAGAVLNRTSFDMP